MVGGVGHFWGRIEKREKRGEEEVRKGGEETRRKR
jgi:hypothetical protein